MTFSEKGYPRWLSCSTLKVGCYYWCLYKLMPENDDRETNIGCTLGWIAL